MRMQTRGAGPHPDVSVAGSVVTVGEVAVNCEERQDEAAVLIDLRQDRGGPVTEGGEGRQVASVYIPPRRYAEVDTGETADEVNPVVSREAVPLDCDQVLVTLWTIQR